MVKKKTKKDISSKNDDNSSSDSEPEEEEITKLNKNEYKKLLNELFSSKNTTNYKTSPKKIKGKKNK